MRKFFLVLFYIVLAIGCRQPDGAIPTPSGEAANKTDDISRDLLNVVEKDAGAVDDLGSDLQNISGSPPPAHLVEALTIRIADALPGTRLDEQSARKLATHLYVTTTARELSQRQVAALRQDITATLISVGVPEPKAQPVSDVADEIQTAISANRRRWWHWR